MRQTLGTACFFLVLVGTGYFLLGVVSPKKESHKQRILVHKPERVSPGMVLHTVRRTAKAWLVDNTGTIHRKWAMDKYVPEKSQYTLKKSPLQHVEVQADGTLVAVIKDSAIIKLNPESKLLSATEGFFHHDIDLLSDGTVVALERKPLEVAYQDINGVLLNDHIVMIRPDGSRAGEYPLFEIVSALISRETVERAFEYSRNAALEDIKNDTPADVLHTNSVEILRSDLPGIAPAGSALVSFRELDLIAIVDFKKGKLLWSYGPGEISSQHHPSLTDTGRILLFDNGRRNKSTRVIEIDPASKEIVWQFDVTDYDEPDFYSAARGSAQRLKNGNTLISVAERGKAIEVTPAKEIVWKYYPELRLKRKKSGAVRTRDVMMYRIERIEDPTTLANLTDSR